jgi:hypothetical protein
VSSGAPPLAELQRRFHALATGAAEPTLAAGLLAPSPSLEPAAGAAVYAEMYDARLADALAVDFPRLEALLGHERFHALAEAYARAHPSDDPDLGRFGRHLPDFLREHPAPERADLADLAELEWARSEVLVEADAVAAGREALAAPGPERFPSARLRLVPALRLLLLDHDALTPWRAGQEGAVPPPPAPGPSAVAVWRNGFEVVHGALPPEEARALETARGGAPLAEVLACFQGERAAEAGLAALLSWVDEGWVAEVVPG